LIGLFDGHGKEGQAVVNFCKHFIVNYYQKNQALWRADPMRFITEATTHCDKALVKRDSRIDANYSGSTQVLYLVYQGCVYLASVGDSRVILATSKPPSYVTPTPPPRGEDKEILDRVKRRRSVSIDKPLQAVQLTKDQKPEEPEEMERIHRMGGVVRRLMDELGRNIGPWRVWRKDANYPGLAMSRSIGDIAGSEIGVISTPLITTHLLRSGEDFFLVSGSDGIWDVMENQEVADFVEAYRYSCVRDTQSPFRTDKIKPENCTIAQLLCEEARTRWLSIVEEEDVLIDDISCVVVELKEASMQLVLPPSRISAPNLDAVDLPERNGASIPTTEVKLRDPRRSSVSE
jgi:serine/threonine protein phosphatase PrpC